jgi:hypothetical protein
LQGNTTFDFYPMLSYMKRSIAYHSGESGKMGAEWIDQSVPVSPICHSFIFYVGHLMCISGA